MRGGLIDAGRTGGFIKNNKGRLSNAEEASFDPPRVVSFAPRPSTAGRLEFSSLVARVLRIA